MTPVTAAVRTEQRSAGWDGAAPTIAVVVSTHGRSHYLAGLLDALELQDTKDFEVVIADNGSPDDTWQVLLDRCARTSLRLLALRLDPHDGPAVPRNTAVARTRAPLLAFTDDDCVPTPGWLAALQHALAPGVTVAQGRTEPQPGEGGGAWGRTLRVDRLTGLYETANLGCPRVAFDVADGFPAERLLSGRAFGEDVLLGYRLAAAGSAVFAPDALMRHRIVPGTYRQFLSERRRLEGFPVLLRRVPQMRRLLLGGVFLSRRTAVADLGLAGVLVAAGLQSPYPLAAALPWAAQCWRAARTRPGRPRLVRAGQLAAGDTVAAAALVTGSVRARRLVL
ncbi:MAG TPA: glycosyltransferase family 2 protein [Mycobacteriales bacterium]|nr:glycosyltransferase family 2 protein [Mycobacteriales bacterium]